jgi:hypothetical protein
MSQKHPQSHEQLDQTVYHAGVPPTSQTNAVPWKFLAILAAIAVLYFVSQPKENPQPPQAAPPEQGQPQSGSNQPQPGPNQPQANPPQSQPHPPAPLNQPPTSIVGSWSGSKQLSDGSMLHFAIQLRPDGNFTTITGITPMNNGQAIQILKEGFYTFSNGVLDTRALKTEVQPPGSIQEQSSQESYTVEFVNDSNIILQLQNCQGSICEMALRKGG